MKSNFVLKMGRLPKPRVLLILLFSLFWIDRSFARDAAEFISSPYTACQKEAIEKMTMEADGDWRSAGRLALKSGKVLKRALEKNQKNIEQMKECVSSFLKFDQKSSLECEPVLGFIQKLIPAVTQARMHLALAYSPNFQSVLNINLIESYLNFLALTPPFLPLPEKFEPLTLKEKDHVKQIFKNFLMITKKKFGFVENQLHRQLRSDQYPLGFESFLSDFNKAKDLEAYLVGWPPWQAYQHAERIKFQNKHREFLLNLLNKFPIIGLLKSSQPTYQDFLRAFDELIANNKAELAKVAIQMSQVEKNPSSAKTEIFALTAYPVSVDFVLSQEIQFCAIATNLALEAKNYLTMKNLVIGTMLIGSGFIFPPNAAISVAAVLSGYSIVESKRIRQNRFQSVYSYPLGTENIYTAKEAQEASLNVAVDWISAPFFISSAFLFKKMNGALNTGPSVY